MAIRLGLGVYVFSCALLFVACTSDSGGDGTGGFAATGGVPAAGGAVATGGTVATGGVPGAGGAPGTGGMPATTGGTPGTGGMLGTGGTPGTGGAPGTGGMGTGGMGTGGMGTGGMGTGGMPNTGAFALTSPVVMDMGMLPATNRCVSLFGAPGPSPALTWTAGPAGTMSYTLVFKDTSAAGTTGAGTIHWVIKDIPAATMMLPAAVPVGAMPASVPGATQVANGLNDIGYRGPCGGMNQYTFTLYAVKTATLAGAATGAAAETAAMANNVGTAKLVVKSMP